MNQENNNILLNHTLSQTAFWMVNKKIASFVGLDGAVFLSDLISKEQYFREKKQLDKNGGFFNTNENLMNDLNIGSTRRLSIQKTLIEKGFVSVIKKGLPAKNYWYIHHNKIVEFLSEENSSHSETGTTNDSKTAITNQLETGTTFNKNKVNNNKTNKSISKDILNKQSLLKSSLEKNKTLISKNDFFIDYWNKLKNTRSHKKNTKIYLETLKKINSLKAGLFYKKYSINKDFMSKNKIDVALIKNKFTDSEIKKGLIRLSLLFTEGYWPYDKSKMPKDLSSLIYNTRTGTSFFLKVLSEKPKKTNEIEKKHTVLDLESYNLSKQHFSALLKNEKDENDFRYKFNTFYKFIQENVYGKVDDIYDHTSFSSYFGSGGEAILLFKRYFEFLSGKKISLFQLEPENFAWKDFLIHCKKEHGYILTPSESDLEEIEFDRKLYFQRRKNA